MRRVGRPRAEGDDPDAVAYCPYCKGPKYEDEPRRGACVECRPVLQLIQSLQAPDEIILAEPSCRTRQVSRTRYWGLAILRGMWPARASRGRAV